MKFAVLLQEQWRTIGADVVIDQMELATFGDRLEQRKFDAMLNAWQIDPDPASVRDEWTSAEMRKGGSNFVSYSNPVFDATVDSAARESDPARAVSLYRRAYRQLTDDAPALWLYELRNVFGISQRLRPVGIRADAWWADLADWRVR
jgi:peptide/nickel transport system substrate-binding protein